MVSLRGFHASVSRPNLQNDVCYGTLVSREQYLHDLERLKYRDGREQPEGPMTREQIERLIAETRARGAAILGLPAIDTIKEVKRASLPEDVALISATIPRERIVMAQTPQAFSYALLRDAFRKAQQDDVTASDEAALVERFGHDVFVVQGSERNIKITRPSDMELARFYLEQERAVVKA